MDIEKELLKTHSKAQASRIQRYIGNDPELFRELVALFFKGSYRLTQRAAWPLSLCVEKHPELAKPHLKAFIKNLSKANQHDAVKRNTFRLLQYADIPKNLYGITADVSFRFLQDPKEPIAVRVFAMTVLANISMKVPELKKELLMIIEDQLPYGSAGFIARAKKVIKQISKSER